MSRPLRIEYPGAWHHVMNRGWNKIAIFKDGADHRQFVDLLKQTGEQFRLQVAAYCLMPNHFHLLVRTPEGNLARCMRHVGSLYTQYVNRKHDSDGPLFRGRYKSILVEEESYLLQLLRYIHQNPLRAGIVDRMEEYPWSSHHGYLTDAEEWAWLHKEPVLDRLRCRKEYLAFVQNEGEEVELAFGLKKFPSMLGGERFVEWVKGKFFEGSKRREVPQSSVLAPDRERIFEAVCSVFNVERVELFKARRGRTNDPRNMAVYLLRTMRGENTAEIAELFGVKTYSSVSSINTRMEERLGRDSEVREAIAKVRALLRQEGVKSTLDPSD
jgi:putative transposase